MRHVLVLSISVVSVLLSCGPCRNWTTPWSAFTAVCCRPSRVACQHQSHCNGKRNCLSPLHQKTCFISSTILANPRGRSYSEGAWTDTHCTRLLVSEIVYLLQPCLQITACMSACNQEYMYSWPSANMNLSKYRVDAYFHTMYPVNVTLLTHTSLSHRSCPDPQGNHLWRLFRCPSLQGGAGGAGSCCTALWMCTANQPTPAKFQFSDQPCPTSCSLWNIQRR